MSALAADMMLSGLRIRDMSNKCFNSVTTIKITLRTVFVGGLLLCVLINSRPRLNFTGLNVKDLISVARYEKGCR